MGVMMQAFHWDCPRVDGHEFGWWDAVRARVPALAAAGFTALWLPPAHKAGNIGGPSMGYDPYDYYDLGEFDQKGGVPTWFGTRQALASLIDEAHAHRMQVRADFEGYPCVFWKDYVNYGLALPGIDALVAAHERLAGGRTEVLLAEHDLYIMQRTSAGSQPGLIYVLNNRGDVWNGAWVTSRFAGATLTPWAWWSASDQSQPSERVVAADGRTDVWAPPRGYCVYGV